MMQVGAVVRLGARTQGGQAASYAEIRDMACRIEDAGFDSIWVYDHFFLRWPQQPTAGAWECWTTLSALAQATTRVQLGTIVLCVPFRNPAIVAKMASTLDEVSGGRLILGLGAGWHEPEFEATGAPFDHRAGRFEEALKIICPLLREGRVDFEGKFYSARDSELVPRGPRAKGPPIMLAGAGPRMLRLAARYGDRWNTAWDTELASVARHTDGMRAACAAEGRNPETLEITALAAVHFADLGPAPRPSLTGTVEELAETLGRYAEFGVGHLMLEVAPHSNAGVDRLAQVVDRFRAHQPG
ncbi:MAG: LLM class flavin-dependent oxidoreductase [Chloroflexi bacterium]|nr:LLM class flavin-dependent oxidoreductase [Chloroflexota bacterium]